MGSQKAAGEYSQGNVVNYYIRVILKSNIIFLYMPEIISLIHVNVSCSNSGVIHF